MKVRLLSLFVIALAASVSADAALPLRSSPIAITPDGARLFAVNPDSASVSVIDTAQRTKLAEIAVGAVPQTVAVSPDGELVVVASRDGIVATIDPRTLRIVATVRAGVELFGVATNGTRIFVTDTGAARILVFDMKLGALQSIETEPAPRGLALVGQKLYVTHFTSGRLSIVDVVTLAVERVVSTGADGNLAQAAAVHGGRVYLPQTRANSTNEALLFDTTVFPIVAVVDAATGEHVTRERLSMDVVVRPSNMPLDLAITAAGKLYVVNAGSDDVAAVDLGRRAAGSRRSRSGAILAGSSSRRTNGWRTPTTRSAGRCR